jgi:molybdate transport system permease protein
MRVPRNHEKSGMIQSVPYGRKFDFLLAIPLVFYLLLIVVLTVGVFTGTTAEAFRIAWQDPALFAAIKLSLVTSLASTVLSLLIAVPSGYVLSRCRFPGRTLMDTLVDIPIVLPPLVMGLALLIFFSTPVGRFLDRGIWPRGIFVYQPLGIVLTQFVVGGAYAVRVLKSGFDSLDPRYEEMAMTLGANRWQAFRKAVVPNILPSLMAGTVICWAKIFGLFGPILLVCGTMRGRTEIMPTTIFLETSIGRIEVALVVGSLMILISLATLFLLRRLGGKGYML